MAIWLLKTEPSDYSFDDLQRDGKTIWDGVTNNLALKNLRSVRRGDRALIYHTGNEKQIVGIGEVVSDPYPDPSKKDPKLVVLDIRADRRFGKPVPLDKIKKLREFAKFDLVRLPRLSVLPVDSERWNKILELSK